MSKVAVVGCGALGLNYGTRLLEAQIYNGEQLNVSLVLRRDYDLVSRQGLAVEYGKASDTKKTLLFPPYELSGKLFRSTHDLFDEKGTMDWVLVCCKSYSIDESLHQSLVSLVGDHTKVIVIMNGLGVEEKFVEWFGTERVFGALSLIACNRGPNPPLQPDGPLVVNVYLDLKLEIAHMTDDPTKTQLAVALFQRTALRELVSLSTNLLRARWDKLCWNLTYAGIGVAMGGLTCDVIVHDASLRELATNVICDVIRVANADIRRQHRERHFGTLRTSSGGDHTHATPQASSSSSSSSTVIEERTEGLPPCTDLLNEQVILEEIWRRTENAGMYKSSTVLDLVASAPLEMRYLFGVPLERARALRRADPTLHFAHLESVILMVEAVSRMGARKAALGVAWQPTFFTDELEKQATP